MAIIHVTEATVGLPNSGRLSGTDGDLVGILDVALPLNGWAIEYTSGNARVYRPGTGNRFRLYVNDDSAVSGDARLATVRGCENASAASEAGLVDPFPTISQCAATVANWHKSTTANTTARLFDILVGESFVIYSCNFGSGTNRWELEIFGDASPALLGDSYNTLVSVRGIASPTFVTAEWYDSWGTGSADAFPTVCCLFWARSYDGTVKSSQSAVASIFNGLGIGSVGANFPQALNGPTTGIDTIKLPLRCLGSTTNSESSSLALPIRGWFPNLLLPQHGGRGVVNTRDTYSNSAVPGFQGQIVCADNTAASAFIVMQTNDGWSPPT